MILLKFTEKKEAFTFDTVDEDIRLFSTKKKAEEWLIKNGFVFGKPDFLSQNSDAFWFHQNSGKRMPLHVAYADLKDIQPDQDDEADYTYRLLK